MSDTPSAPRHRYILRWLTGSILGAGVLFFAFGPYALAHIVSQPPWLAWRSPEEGLEPLSGHWVDEFMNGAIHDPQTDWSIAYEEIEFATAEGMTLRGWWVPAPQPTDAAIVFAHGGGFDRRSWLPHLPMFHKAGYGALMFDNRDHGISDGKGRGISFGVREHEDVIAAVRYVRDTHNVERVAAVGTCHGSPSIILAAAQEPGIDVAIVEDPNTTFERALTDYRLFNVLPDWFVAKTVRIVTERANRGDTPDPIDVIHQIGPRPIMLIHGTDDDTVAPEQSEALYAAAQEPKELWIAEGAKHSGTYIAYPEEFEERVIGFLSTHLPARPMTVATAE